MKLMETTTPPNQSRITSSVLLIGNNPIDLSDVYERLRNSKKINYIAEILFDAKEALKKVTKSRPNYIVVDDNLGKEELRNLLETLKSNARTREIPITIIQNTNKDDISREGAEEFILKKEITSESISRSLTNSLKIARMQAYLRLAQRKRKKFLAGLK